MPVKLLADKTVSEAAATLQTPFRPIPFTSCSFTT